MTETLSSIAIELAAHDLFVAQRIGNEADPQTRKHVLDAVKTLGDAFGITVVDDESTT